MRKSIHNSIYKDRNIICYVKPNWLHLKWPQSGTQKPPRPKLKMPQWLIPLLLHSNESLLITPIKYLLIQPHRHSHNAFRIIPKGYTQAPWLMPTDKCLFCHIAKVFISLQYYMGILVWFYSYQKFKFCNDKQP